MKLLHIADLHLGKTLHEMPLLNVQEKMLDDICEILRTDEYTALLIAGDVYDRAIPSAESVSLFSRFLARVRECCSNMAVFIIPGNHDSAQRLAFAHEILQNQHIYIAPDTARLDTPVILTKGEEKLAVYMLPFLSFGSFPEEIKRAYGVTGDSQAEMAAVASKILQKAVQPDIPALLMAHLFTIGGQSSASERSFIGTAEYINPELFSFFDYTALGHLHRCQRVTDRMYYSGSPLAYSFDESEDSKCVLSIDIDCKPRGITSSKAVAPLQIARIPIVPERPLKRLEDCFAAFFTEQTYNEWRNCYLEITLTDSEVITHPMQLLRQKFPFLLSIRQKSFMDRVQSGAVPPLQEHERLAEDTFTLLENFNRFEILINGETNQIKQELFEQLCKEVPNET
jgi:exonuclease sbcCD, D subunit